jgi:hypothetical protein
VTGELARTQFDRVVAEIAAASTTDKALAILRAARMGNELAALSENQLSQLVDIAREKGDAA